MDQKSYNTGDRETNFSFRPIMFDTTPDDVVIGTILYYAYYNSVFDLTYKKIALGRKNFWIKQISIKKTLKSIFFWYVGISRLMLLLALKIIKYDEKGLENYLVKLFIKPMDDRLILKINNKWEINGKWELFWKTTNEKLLGLTSESNLEYIKPSLLKIYNKSLEINSESKTFLATFVNVKTKIPHNIFPEASKDSKIWAYQTDFQKAYNKDFYNKEPLIHKYDGIKKQSTLLEGRFDEFKQIRKEKITTVTNQFKGALDYGYNDEKLSEKYNDGINELRIIEIEINKLLDEIGIESNEIKKTIWTDLTLHTNAEISEILENSEIK